ncbi:hypothetical protein H4R33_002158 [Dimargaris cristalligena]|uniref:CCR4-NOT transcription complex subunit 11 n=1 Tax=Dimargaris cristalligena TaxID=215637 RepID=A0A4P9ZQD9_9FUNG|nr:hypothetical protein H4R33_002158 [Dimargaris cristalligena]RKP34600.1 hypothetical protein BJ085DRAFT_37058 [Dimargaris cristalligena]|eukprot:RKP34600.1 hypothetical protein BJ085DRAFT_37058 [Dimargaris cristalligena]
MQLNQITVDRAHYAARAQYSAMTFQLESSTDGIYNELPGIELAFNKALEELAQHFPSTKATPHESAGSPVSQLCELQLWIDNAAQGPLNFKRCEFIETALNRDMSLLDQLEITPEKFQDILTNNSRLVKDTLQPWSASINFILYVEVILIMPINLDIIEIMTWLVEHRKLEDEHLRIFITHCIAYCGRLTDRDSQTRQVKIISLFIQRLLNAGAIREEDYFAELSSFCVEYARVKEATVLFRRLLEWEQTQRTS